MVPQRGECTATKAWAVLYATFGSCYHTNMAESINWLHLTDLHFGLDRSGWLWPRFKHELLQDIERLQGEVGGWDLVFFTGDFTQRGTQEEFTALNKVCSSQIATSHSCSGCFATPRSCGASAGMRRRRQNTCSGSQKRKQKSRLSAHEVSSLNSVILPIGSS